MNKLRLGIVGLGQRGSSLLKTFLAFSCVDIVALCDVYSDRVDSANEMVLEKRGVSSKKYSDFNQFLKDTNLDAVIVASSWEEHINQTIQCIKEGIPVGMEVGGAYTIKDCFKLVKAYEKHKTPMMLLENCCYDKFETLLSNLNNEGKFGEIIHCHGAYSHDLREEITNGNIKRHYRLRNYIKRNCENYPTHELGPIAKLLNINQGNRFVSVVSVSSKSRGLETYIQDGKCEDKSLKGVKFKQGDIISTIITCENGETITLTLDTTLPGYYSRQLQIKGTRGFANQESNMILFDEEREEIWQPVETIKKYIDTADNYKDYLPKYWRDITPEQINLGHGGMDFYMAATFIDCLLNRKEMPINVYDTASWYVITALSEKSIKHHGKVYKIPDFTKGRYKTRKKTEAFEKEANYEKYY